MNLQTVPEIVCHNADACQAHYFTTELYNWKIKSVTGDKNKWINIPFSDYAFAQCLQCCC